MSYPAHLEANQPSHAELPALPGDGPQIDADRLRAAGTSLWLTLAYGLLGILIVGSLGFLILGLVLGYITDLMLSRRTVARLRGSAVQAGPYQLAAIDACARQFSARLGLAEAPTVLVAESSMLNAVALRIGRRRCVMLLDDVVWGAVDYQIPGALRFVIAHELAHHALGHAGVLRSYLRLVLPPLSRLDELSADAVALQLVGTRQAAAEGLMMLTVGPQLLRYINRDALFAQAREVAQDRATKKAEQKLTHPLLLRRLHAVMTAPTASG